MERNIFDIRYVRLYISLQMLRDCIVPKHKVSAIRGGIGEMLLRANCIRDRNCEVCDFESECLVQRTLYSKFEEKPDFVSSGDSVGYVLECEDLRQEMRQGDLLNFQMTLFGKTIVYFSQFIQALYALGQAGLGKEQAQFDIYLIRNEEKEGILWQQNIYMERCKPKMLSSYVEKRVQAFQGRFDIRLNFYSPLTQKYQGSFLQDFSPEPILRSIQRRVYVLDCFEGIDGEEAYNRFLPQPVLLRQDSRLVQVPRYSTRKDQKVILRGIIGNMLIGDIPEEILPYLAAGEILHIGKNTSFGFGGYELS